MKPYRGRQRKDSRRVIVLETRHPTTEEKDLLGQMNPANDHVFYIFLNKQQSQNEWFDTLIHELLHFVCSIQPFKPRMTEKAEEKRVELATRAAIDTLRGRLPKNETR
jgi:Zn-dependent peptidase ImmA (M78 family)